MSVLWRAKGLRGWIPACRNYIDSQVNGMEGSIRNGRHLHHIMGGEGPSKLSAKSKCFARKRIMMIVVVVAIAVAVTIPLLYIFVSSKHLIPSEFEPYVSYSYVVGISSNTSDEFTVLCPFPADVNGHILTRAVWSLRVTGNATAANVTTEHGEALEIRGTGLILITWNSRSELPGPWDGYKDHHYLTLLDGPGYASTANVHSDAAKVLFNLNFDYDYVYGNLGADFINYEIVTTLEVGWNLLSVDYSHQVA